MLVSTSHERKEIEPSGTSLVKLPQLYKALLAPHCNTLLAKIQL